MRVQQLTFVPFVLLKRTPKPGNITLLHFLYCSVDLDLAEFACCFLQVQANGHAEPQTTRLHVGHLTRNVNEGHIKEIFSTFGTLKSVELSIDKVQGYLVVK